MERPKQLSARDVEKMATPIQNTPTALKITGFKNPKSAKNKRHASIEIGRR